MQPDRHVFVYGTLRRGEQRDINRLNPPPVYVGKAVVTGTLFDLGAYPGILLAGQDVVQGEVYRISAALERVLDEIEEVWPQPTGQYAKREVLVRVQAPFVGKLDGNRELLCLVYEITMAHTLGQAVIDQGDWVSYRVHKKS